MTPRWIAPLLFALVIGACNRAPENKDAVRQAIVEHLGKNSGLDLSAMDMDVTKVDFQGEQATAMVSFKPKASPDAGMSMNYTLKREGSKWAVQKAAGGGHGGALNEPSQSVAPAPGGNLPPGHPPVAAEPPVAPKK